MYHLRRPIAGLIVSLFSAGGGISHLQVSSNELAKNEGGKENIIIYSTEKADYLHVVNA